MLWDTSRDWDRSCFRQSSSGYACVGGGAQSLSVSQNSISGGQDVVYGSILGLEDRSTFQVLSIKNDNSKLAPSRMPSNKKACCIMWTLGLRYQAKASRNASSERAAASGPPASVLQEALLGDRDQMSQTEVVRFPVASQECCSQQGEEL